MTTKHYTYQFKLKPNKSQQELLNKHFGCTRLVYNLALELKKTLYNDYGLSISKNEISRQLTSLKQQYSFLNEVTAHSLQQSLRDLDQAYKNFFKYGSGFPQFKSKRNKNSYRVVRNIKIDETNNKVIIPKFKKGIKISQDRRVEGEIKFATIVRDRVGKYFINITTEQQHKPKYEKTGKSVGLDKGIKHLVITSDGIKYENHKYLRKHEKKLEYEQRQLSKKKPGSNSRENQARQVARLHLKIANCRKDQLHKLTTELVKNYDVISVEDLNIQGMLKNRKLSKSISDTGWGMMNQMLKYKTEWEDKHFVKIDKFFPSSKMCSECGELNQELDLSVREWVCESCGAIHDRDDNAAINIDNEGLKILQNCGSGTDSQSKRTQVRYDLLCKSKQKQVEASTLVESGKLESS